MYHTASAGPDQPTYITDSAQLPVLFQQLVADLADPAITYLLGGHYYDRTNHPRYRHFPAVFALRQGEVANVEVGLDFVAFDTESSPLPRTGRTASPGPVNRPLPGHRSLLPTVSALPQAAHARRAKSGRD